MNVLEKILENLEKRMNYRKSLVRYEKKEGTITDVARNQGALEELVIIAKIIDSNINDGKDTNVPGNDGWIPCSEHYPNTEDYILLSFKNFPIPLVGRYEEDEAGGAFYIGDETETCVSQGIFVNAWQQLPTNYQPEME